jgi:hypothetical protein
LKQEKKYLQVFDETLPNFIKRKHPSPRKGEKKKQGPRTKVQASKKPERSGPQGGKATTKYQNLHQSLEAYQLNKGEVQVFVLKLTIPVYTSLAFFCYGFVWIISM